MLSHISHALMSTYSLYLVETIISLDVTFPLRKFQIAWPWGPTNHRWNEDGIHCLVMGEKTCRPCTSVGVKLLHFDTMCCIQPHLSLLSTHYQSSPLPAHIPLTITIFIKIIGHQKPLINSTYTM